ncbi:NRDE family protein [Flagellimonas sp. S174]|uniref:NRDE family protein n=1 Tax=Flagellimonas sp. S174 TaxID=3410790 RepID=UPI003BF5BA96
MCTVSFIANKGNYYITSNRDEHISRPTAFEPKREIVNGIDLLFPKDPKAGGTWFAINEMGHVGVLLNGAFKRHKSLGNYRKSRGLVLLDIMSKESPEKYLDEIDLEGIEPFTVVLFQQGRLLEMRWDETKRHRKPLSNSENYIWSSATLYDKEVIRHRESLFSNFMGNVLDVNPEDVVDFHSNNHSDFENGFIIDRKTGLKTFSVTQAVLKEDDISLGHFDLLNDKKSVISFNTDQLTLH